MYHSFCRRPWTRGLALVFVLLPNLCVGALIWETQRIGLTAKASDKTAVGLFPFVNGGSTPVTLTSVKSDCGCTVAELAKQTYAPGERGEIKTVFTFEGRVGHHTRNIQVMTDDPSSPLVHLILEVNISELITYSPRLLLWRVGDEKKDKATVILAGGANRIANIEIKSITPDEVTARVETVEAGKKYQLVVQPFSTAKSAQTTIACLVTFADGATQTISVYALVR